MKFDFTITERPKDKQVCDFCSSPDVWTVYDCEDFVAFNGPVPAEKLQAQSNNIQVVEGTVPETGIVNVQGKSKGAWVACKSCSELIDENRWHDLLERCIEEFIKKHPETKPFKNELKRKIRDLHLEFRKLRRQAN